jgi:hypothetical protein
VETAAEKLHRHLSFWDGRPSVDRLCGMHYEAEKLMQADEALSRTGIEWFRDFALKRYYGLVDNFLQVVFTPSVEIINEEQTDFTRKTH